MPGERRGQAIRVRIILVNWQQEEPTGSGGGRQLSMDGTSRVTGDSHARFCERLGVKFPGPTRRRSVMIVPTATCRGLLSAFQRVQRTGTQGFVRLARTSAVPSLLCRAPKELRVPELALLYWT